MSVTDERAGRGSFDVGVLEACAPRSGDDSITSVTLLFGVFDASEVSTARSTAIGGPRVAGRKPGKFHGRRLRRGPRAGSISIQAELTGLTRVSRRIHMWVRTFSQIHYARAVVVR
jgi:hypothetical protein